MPDTLGSLRAEVIEWLGGENVSETRIDAAINDAIDALWQALILAAIQVFMAGPCTLSLSSGDEGRILISVPDPTAGPSIAGIAGGTLAQRTVYAAYTLVTESGSETVPSPTTNATIAINNLAEIGPVSFVDGVIGWNVYAGTSSSRLVKQNDEPIPFDSSWDEPPEGVSNNPDDPLPPMENTTGDNIAYIRHLEFKTSSNAYKSYNAGDLDSEMMRRMAGTIASTSEYQNYAWDLINQRQLEIRPAVLATSFKPRIFYVVKPRRLRFANAPLPFPTIPSTEFLRTYALSLLFLTLHEYTAADAWERKSDKALVKAVRALTQTNTNRNDRVTPYMY